jgi:hypothetical protein
MQQDIASNKINLQCKKGFHGKWPTSWLSRLVRWFFTIFLYVFCRASLLATALFMSLIYDFTS